MKTSFPTSSYSYVMLCALFGLLLSGCRSERMDASRKPDREIDETNDDNENEVQTGALRGFRVSGLSYSTDTQSGITNEEGHFQYRDNETVRFSVGDVVIGEAKGNPELTLFDLAHAEKLVDQNAIKNAIAQRGSYWHLINLAVFLESIDANGNASDGIAIQPEIVALLTGTHIDFERNPWRFRFGDFYWVMKDAQDFFETPHPISQRWDAMETLYRLLGLETSFLGITREESYGLNDSAPTKAELYAYESNGSLTRYEIDDDGDGDGEFTKTNHYDDWGHLIIVEHDHDNDGESDFVFEYEYDALGNLIHSERYDNNTGAIFYEKSYEYNHRGNLIRLDDYQFGKETIETYEYDERDFCIRRTKTDADTGEKESIETYEYDERGNLITWKSDLDGNGTFEFVETYQYDERDNQIRKERSTNVDYLSGKLETREYDLRGNLVRWERDSDEDGIIDYVETFEYDEAQNRIGTKRDWDADGANDFILVHTYDSTSKELSTECERVGEISPFVCEIKKYQSTGWRIFQANPHVEHGTIQETLVFGHVFER